MKDIGVHPSKYAELGYAGLSERQQAVSGNAIRLSG